MPYLNCITAFVTRISIETGVTAFVETRTIRIAVREAIVVQETPLNHACY